MFASASSSIDATPRRTARPAQPRNRSTAARASSLATPIATCRPARTSTRSTIAHDAELGRFEKFDELYWNVTGNGWIFPIDAAEVTVRLPQPVKFTQQAYYTGREGSQGQSARLLSEEPGQATIVTTAPLGPEEGFTVALAWPKGVVDAPSQGEKFSGWFARYGASLISLLGLWAMAAYYWIAWTRAGRDPDAGTMVPLFAPPDDMSPAAVRYMMKQKTDPRTMSSTLVSLGVQGEIRIDKDKGGFFSSSTTTISRTPNASKGAASSEEESFLTALIPYPSGSIEADNKNHEAFSAAQKAIDKALSGRFDGKLFFRNWAWIIGGIGLFLAVVMAAGAAASWGAGGSERIALPFAVFAVSLIFRFVPALGNMRGKSLIVGAVGVGLIGLMVVSGAPLLGRALEEGNFWPFLPLAIGLPLVISSLWWMPSPTVEGQKLIDRIRASSNICPSPRPTARPHAPPDGHARTLREVSALCGRARRRKPLGGSLHVRSRGGRSRPSRRAGLRLVQRLWLALERCDWLHKRDRLVRSRAH